jgi:hypothetical protein
MDTLLYKLISQKKNKGRGFFFSVWHFKKGVVVRGVFGSGF